MQAIGFQGQAIVRRGVDLLELPECLGPVVLVWRRVDAAKDIAARAGVSLVVDESVQEVGGCGEEGHGVAVADDVDDQVGRWRMGMFQSLPSRS